MNGPNNNAEVRVSGPGGWGGSVRGLGALVVVILSLALGGLLFMNYYFYDALLKASTQQSVAHDGLAAELRIQTYIQSLPFDKRPRLLMPPGLEKRLDRREEPW